MTHREIARELGISPAALSLIINRKPGVSDATRETVIRKLREMGRGDLLQKKAASDNLAFVIYKRNGAILDAHPFFLLLMEHIENRAREYGCQILLSTVDKRRPLPEQTARLAAMDCRGAIVFATEMEPEDMAPLLSLPFPVIALDNEFATLPCNAVAINNQMGISQAVGFLAGRGLRRIGYLKSSQRISSFAERERAYLDALAALGLTARPGDTVALHFTEEGSYRDMAAFLTAGPDLPDAFVCDDDTIAAGAMRALSEHGLRIPEDISLVGFNDRPSCAFTVPPLTSISISKHDFSYAAVDELIRMIRDARAASPETRCRKLRIGTRLVERETVREG